MPLTCLVPLLIKFKRMKINNNIKSNSYKLHAIDGLIQTIYLFEYSDKILLADCACRADLNRIEDFIENKINRSMNDIKLAVVTHMHPDHAGLARKLRDKYDIPLATHYASDLWYSGFRGKLQHILDILMAKFVSYKKNNQTKLMWYPSKIKADYILKDGDKLPFFDDWEVVFTPGHTAHDISIYNSNNSIIYIADVVLKINDKFVLPFPVTIPKLMEKTLIKLSKLPVKEVIMAHGGQVKFQTSENFFKPLIKQVYEKHKGVFLLFKYISMFPPCVKAWEKCLITDEIE